MCSVPWGSALYVCGGNYFNVILMSPSKSPLVSQDSIVVFYNCIQITPNLVTKARSESRARFTERNSDLSSGWHKPEINMCLVSSLQKLEVLSKLSQVLRRMQLPGYRPGPLLPSGMSVGDVSAPGGSPLVMATWASQSTASYLKPSGGFLVSSLRWSHTI